MQGVHRSTWAARASGVEVAWSDVFRRYCQFWQKRQSKVQAWKKTARLVHPSSGPGQRANCGYPSPVPPGQTQSATQLGGRGYWDQESFPFPEETPSNLPPTLCPTPQYPNPFSGIRHSLTHSAQGTPSGSSGGRGDSPKAALLRAWACRATGRASSGVLRMHGRQTPSSRQMKADVAPQMRHVPMRPPLSQQCIPTGIVSRRAAKEKAPRYPKESHLDKTEVRNMMVGRSRRCASSTRSIRRAGREPDDFTRGEPMRIALVNTNRIYPPIAPIGLDYVAETLRASGHRPELLDLCWEEQWEPAIARFLANGEFGLVGGSLRNTDA